LKFSRGITIGFLGIVMALSAHGQAAPQAPAAPPLPSVDQVLNRYINAVGGRSALTNLTSRVTTGTIEVPAANLSGTIELREKAPDRILSEIRIAGVLFSQGFDGTVGWVQNVRDGLHEQTGAELSEAKRDADFYHPLDMRKLYTKLTIVGVEKINDHDTYKMEAEIPEGAPDEIYFDTATGLPARVVSHRHNPQGIVDFVEDFDDYREVDGIKRPFTIHETTGDNVLTIHISDIRDNVFLDDSVFAKPAAQ
jgi:zinc protease